MKNSEKEKLRTLFREKRRAISQKRREEAEKKILEEFYPTLSGYKHILSFASFQDEINVWPLNERLLQEKRLLLPRVEGDDLTIYSVEAFEALLPSNLGILEPDPTRSTVVNKQKIECALIPGLAFDSQNERIGYGKGHYDRLLSRLEGCLTIGVGFREQLTSKSLPIEKHDKRLERTAFF